MAQKTYNSIVLSGETLRCYYTTNFPFITGKGTIEPEGNQAYTLPLSYSIYSDDGETSNRTNVLLNTLLTASPYKKYIFGKLNTFQYENANGFNLPTNGGSDYATINSKQYIVTTKGVPFYQRVSFDSSNETFGSSFYFYPYCLALSEYLTTFQSAFVNISFTAKTGGEDSTVVYEKGYSYKFHK